MALETLVNNLSNDTFTISLPLFKPELILCGTIVVLLLARLFAEGTLMRGPRRDRVTCRSRSHSTTCFTRTPHATDRPRRANEAQADEQKDLLPATQGHVDRAG